MLRVVTTLDQRSNLGLHRSVYVEGRALDEAFDTHDDLCSPPREALKGAHRGP